MGRDKQRSIQTRSLFLERKMSFQRFAQLAGRNAKLSHRISQSKPYTRPALLGDPCLRIKSNNVTQDYIDSTEFHQVYKVMQKKVSGSKATEMFITAPQLGVNRRIIAFNNVRIEEGRFFPDEKHFGEWYLLI